MASTSASAKPSKDSGLAVVRIKPMGAGAGGVEVSGAGLRDGEGALRFSSNPPSVAVNRKKWNYPNVVLTPEVDNSALYDDLMPQRIQALFDGVNVNLMAYGQTGTGKTHTIFGAPGIMARAGKGTFGVSTPPEYGICPRAILDVLARVQKMGDLYQVTASAVEISAILGNIDLMGHVVSDSDRAKGGLAAGAGRFGVSLDRKARLPRLYGMREIILDGEASVCKIFGALARRCTAGTGMNQTSSRTHCFVWLTLRRFDPASQTVVTSRFQFVDLAGSERMRDAHNTWNYKEAGMEGIAGMCTNYSLMMLSSAVRAVVREKKKRSKTKAQAFNLPDAYLFDLIPLLKESISGIAMTTVIVCLSQAPDNSSQSVNALDFGSEFAQLPVRPRKRAPVKVAKLLDDAKRLYYGAKAALTNARIAEKFKLIRQAQARDGEQTMALLTQLTGIGVGIGTVKGGGGGGGGGGSRGGGGGGSGGGDSRVGQKK